MSWSARFKDMLASPAIAPVWQLRTVPLPFTTRAPVVVSSHPGYGGIVGLAADGVVIAGESVDLVSWNTTHGGFRVGISIPSAQNLWANFTRGTVVQLYMGFAGWAESDFEPVALGMVSQISSTSSMGYAIDVAGLGTLLAGRLDRTADKSPLFNLLPQSTTLANNFAATDTQADLTDASGFERETAGLYCLLVTPTTGSPFYVTGTGKAANSITGITASTAALDTTRVDAVAGDTVQSVAYIAGHPIDIARKVLVSTGAGTNGAYDTLPKSWGLALPDSLLDHADIGRIRNVAMAPASGTWDLIATETDAQADPGAWLASYLAPTGCWITLRQGRITFRAAQTPHTAKVKAQIAVGQWITRDGLVQHTFFDLPQASGGLEYTSARVYESIGVDYSETKEDPAEVLPAGNLYSWTVAIYGSNAPIRQEIQARTFYWVLRIPERLVIDTAGWWCSQLCPGDIVDVTTDRVTGRPSGSALYRGRFVNRQAMVLGVAPALLPGGAFSTRLDLSLMPETKG